MRAATRALERKAATALALLVLVAAATARAGLGVFVTARHPSFPNQRKRLRRQ